MTRLVLAALVTAASLSAGPVDQGLRFRSSTDIVPVYVSVRSGGSFVQRLEAKDFELQDNGVKMEIDSVSSDAVPIDVTLVVDTSSSVINSLTAFKADVGRIAELLRPEEQMRLITFDTDVREILPMQPAPKRPPVSEIRLGDATSLNDALLFSMARDRRADRRHLVFVFTDGYDTSSLLNYGALPEIASRADALLHIVLVRPNVLPSARSSRDFSLIAEAAARTGGATYQPGGRDDIVLSFQEAIEAFRRSYVVVFAPRDSKEGWHTLSVNVVRPGNYDVRARQGYYPR
jgi:VWFA-related protein